MLAEINTPHLVSYLDNLLECSRFKDYCPNGLQVEGALSISKIVTGVTASEALLRAAIECQADTLLVHHGWFWRGEDERVSGIKRTRLALALKHNLNLLAYHLPLDAHPLYGNNIQLGLRMGWQTDGQFGEQNLGMLATLEQPLTATEIAAQVNHQLERKPLLVGPSERIIRRIAWCTGAAQSYFQQAITAGADLFVSGEISEQTVHLANETGVAYLAAGHHATERYGVQALGRHLAGKFGLEVKFIDISNPV